MLGNHDLKKLKELKDLFVCVQLQFLEFLAKQFHHVLLSRTMVGNGYETNIA